MVEFIRGPGKRFSMPESMIVTPTDEQPRVRVPSVEDMTHYQHDPRAFVLETFAHPEGETLEAWQDEFLTRLTHDLQEGRTREPEPRHLYYYAVVSGKGAGKTRLMAQLFLWHLASHEGQSKTLATSVTGFQTRSRFWHELLLCYGQWRFQHFFRTQSTRIEHVQQGEKWSGTHQTWNIDRPEAFHGWHAPHVAYFCDEASGIPDAILATIEGGATDPEVFILYTSNATRTTGRFRECFRRFKDGWTTYQIDTRTVSRRRVSQEFIDRSLAEANGDENADSFKRDVRGEFPSADIEQVIPPWILEKACERTVEQETWTPIHVGVDIARKGDNSTVIAVRQGAYFREVFIYNQQELEDTAERIIDVIERYRRYHTFVYADADGLGIGAIRMVVKQGYRITEVHSGTAAFLKDRYVNRKTEMYYRFRTWLRDEGCLDVTAPYFDRLQREATNIYFFNDAIERRAVESKETMRSRGIPSPDLTDACVYSCMNLSVPRAQLIEMHI